MSAPPLLPNEQQRLRTLQALQLHEGQSDPVLEGLVRTAVQALGCSAAAISFVDANRRWFKAALGFTRLEAPRELSICAHTLAHGGLLEIADVRADARFADNPAVSASTIVRFYAGMPIGLDGLALGTLCVVDSAPRELNAAQRAVLADLALVAEHWLRSRREHLALLEREREYRLLAEQMPAIVYRVAMGRSPVLAYVSPALKTLGHRPEAWLAQPDAWWQAVHADDRVRVHEQLQHALTVEATVELEYRVADAFGGWRHVHDMVRNMGLDESGMTIVQGAMFDITERRRERAWMSMISAGVEQAREAVVITNAKGSIEYVNDSALRRYGYSRTELMGKPVAMLRSDTLPDATCRDMQTRVLAGRRWRGLLNSRRKDGSVRIEVATVIPVHDTDHNVSHALAIAEDVTEKRLMRKELDSYRERMESLVVARTAAIENAKAQADAASQAKSDFLATVSHEIRTPMTGIIGAVELLERSVLTQYQQTLTSTVRESADALLSMVNNVLDFSRIDAGHLSVECAPLQLRDLLEDIRDALLPLAMSRGVYLHVFVDPDLPDRVMGDAMRLRQIVTNLLGNAIKFSAGLDKPGRVSLRAYARGAETLRISVADNGIGLSAQAQSRLFQPFVQADRSTARKYGGSGLGLVISHRLALAMRGHLAVSSAAGQGARFDVDLPLLACTADPAQAAAPARAMPDLSGLKCHLVVNNEEWAGDWRAYLLAAGAQVVMWREMPDHTVFAAQGSEMALIVQAGLLMPASSLPPDLSAVPRVELHHGRRRTPRTDKGRCIVLDIESMRRASLLQAVAQAVNRLPTAESSLTAHTVAAAPRPIGGLPVTAQRGLILVAEDNATMRLVIEHQLAALGFEAEFAVDGDDAMRMWRDGSDRYSLLLTDLQMPGLDDYGLAQAIRLEEQAPRRMPIVALTASALADEVQRCQDVGIDDVLSKPVLIDEIGAIVGHWFARGRVVAEPRARVAAAETASLISPV